MKYRLILMLLPWALSSVMADDADPFHEAFVHRQKGRYAEAEEALDQLAKQNADPARLAIELSRVQEAVGEWDQLTEQLEAAAKTSPDNPNLLSRLAEVYFRQGRYAPAEKIVNQTLKLDGQHPLAHWVLAELSTETGKLDQALENYVWFIKYYNRAQPEDAQTLELVARGSLQYARWKGSSQILKFVVNTLCPDMLKADENAWQAHAIAGDLLLEKYNRAQSLPELNRGLAINPRAADVLVSLGNAAYQKLDMEQAEGYADQALKINPHHIAACWLKADISLSAGQVSQALDAINKALDVNPHEQRTLARQAAAYILRDGPPPTDELKHLLANLSHIENYQTDNPDEFTKRVIALAERNPRPGYFLAILAEALESRRKYDLAEVIYGQAINSMPQLSAPKTALGMLYMRIGKTQEAAKLLDDAFEADPFHVRVSNMRKVLKLLDGYETIATDHFVIRVDSELDKVLGEYMADYLEEIYPELTKQFGYEPPQRTHFEVYNQSKGLSAHQWFSARMVGLPWIQTIGASTGVIVALASPTATDEPFNWARVLRHEFVHIITLQQTKFNIPHWFTEALAVTAEGGNGPEIWNALLLDRVPKGDIRSLDELNEGFTRPKSPEDWQFAYCQSRLYAKYMMETYGRETIPKLLDAYRRNESTKQAIPKVFGVDVQTFETGYREFLDKRIAEIEGSMPEEKQTLAEREKAYHAKPDDATVAGKYAAALLETKKFAEARELAEQSLALDKTEPHAAVVLATLEIRDRKIPAAIKRLEAAMKEPPHREVLELLARLKLSQEKYAEARDLYRRGQTAFPHSSAWLKGLAAVAIKMEDEESLKSALKELAEREIDNAAYPKKLAQMALKEEDYESAKKHSLRTLYIDVMDAGSHQSLAQAYEGLKNYKKAIQEYQVALQLAPATIEAELGLARALIQEKQTDQAVAVLEKLLKREPDHQEAQALLDDIKK